ncbi:PP2C family protein-serine/threonine phosphatase [Actinacidiphila bryophytorum]|uniref:Stage II sporulation protein E (SpoIIE) n=1 Tax=Actinacidiphila bryophytorum TaxID=1436133 RepID=A0A9W4GYI4_9ACTN|nr:PP2C family protein-serine/threonine phosphatase [Actinacidiphila bryophytorum]MBM9439182.1 serine/threonine-protein phosphatase [Actinacidiphila bryophytorum]MBN6547307.1 serine/threonine-protein phosphatase [Actinacidiphila bryophytorum]CAG7621195.1 Stage II sporulation protein E (SpoIIE) [Actinacidiphila bryophytorum]
MARSGTTDGPRVPGLVRSPAARLAAPLLLLVLLVVIDEAAGPQIRIGGLMLAVPALSAVFLSPRAVVVVALVTLPCLVIAADSNNQLDSVNFPVTLSTSVLIGVASVLAARVRARRERELAQARWVAGVAQRTLLRPLPQRLGRFAIASTYMAADREAAIGGDLYATADLGGGRIRVLVGDVQGKGMAAVEVASMLLGAFRRAARQHVPLPVLPRYLDRNLREDLTDLGSAPPPPPGSTAPAAPASDGPLERFVTAVVVEAAAGGDSLDIVNCGHPPPILLHRDQVVALDAGQPALPLGLGDLGPEEEQVDRHELAVGDVLLLYTDGVIEARDDDGAFYPLTERLAGWLRLPPGELIDVLTADLLHHAGRRLGDDVAIVAVQRVS